MGTTGSSSKRKSSSSSLKKAFKKSSQVRRRKISRSKIRRKKSKKLRCQDDSVSYSDDDSRSSVFVSSSSSEDDYRRKRSRSRTRRDERVTKKRGRRISSSREIIRDSSRVKKRKGSKRKADLDTRKKTSKKKRRRDVSISSISSGSWSCSTCRDGSSRSGESEYEKPRGRSERKERHKGDIGKGKSETKRSRYRSRSSSSCSKRSEGSGYQSEEKLIGESSSRRLRSVIIFAKEPDEEEERELEKDGNKEEIFYDHDDYPSCKSNDSNDGESKGELAHHSHATSEKKRWVENVQCEEVYMSDIRTTEVTEGGNDGGDRYDGSNPSLVVVEANNCSKENRCEVSAAIGIPNSDDLESILRQKALENLKKFRGGLQADQKGKSDNDLKQSSTAKPESVQIKSYNEDNARVVSAAQVVDHVRMPATGRNSVRSTQNDGKAAWDGEYSKTEFGADGSVQIKSHKEDGTGVVSATQVLHQRSVPTRVRNFISSSQKDGMISVVKLGGTETGLAKQGGVCPPNRLAIASNPKEKDSTAAGAIIDKSKPGTSALRQELSGTCATLKQVPASQASPKAKLLVTKSCVDKSAAETAKTVPQSSNNNGEKVDNACSSAAPESPSHPKPTSGDQSSKESQEGEAKEGSQFENKTMSVMRGGEMVQVSYKVYIPKKAPALARRQLRR
ncbi:hypothetical protein L1049_000963 [Liquidambar formosana]|uniref:Uncharacterized protein n=1 Tax=Liquidambar formosana TaxID=63359 RepID=A0AAP0NDS3_LIQFO